WSTDVSRSWGGFRPQVTIMLNAGLSGLGYMSHDVGGFALDPEKNRDGELYIRWLELGLFSPVLRTHAQGIAEPYHYTEFGDLPLRIIRERYRWLQLGLFSPMLRTHSQDIAEPYNYKEYGDLTQRIIRQRYNWLPYNYNLAYENTTQGLPLVRPLGFYESDNNIARYEAVTDQYLWGRDVMVAPVMQQGAVSRDITFPEGTWVDYNHPTRRYEGHTTVSYDAPIEVLPLFVRAGAFIPQATNKMENVGDYNPDNLEIRYYTSNQPSEYTLFEDDMHSTETLGNGNHRLIHFSATPQAGSCVITIRGEGTFPGASPKKNYRLTLPGITTMPKQVKVNGKKAGKVTLDKQRGMLVIPVSIPNINNATTVEIIQ
ncbi:MAG: DUF5110 domain-containing protein, partial [Muribaculaceae bacterium]|nr:DUF5110 domain-containing protein [Muribaculaceae bacterium]